MRLLAEVPTKHMAEFTALFDGEFALAHLVLSDKTYADYMLTQSKFGRLVILDNSMHELPAPLSVPEILEAADRIKPSFVIPPDKLGDVTFTYEQFEIMRKANLAKGHKLAAVMCGSNAAERATYYMNVRQYIGMICFPFREPRWEWMQELVRSVPKHSPWPPYIHLLGVSELAELQIWNHTLDGLGWPHSRRSVDTNKMLKHGIAGHRMNTMDSVRNGKKLDFGAELTREQKEHTFFNIAYIRKFLV